jgi:hypothetical protein
VVQYPRVEICGFLNATSSFKQGTETMKLPQLGIFNQSMIANIWRRAIAYLQEYDHEKLKPCPLMNHDINMNNYSASIKQDFEKILPDGDYRYEHRMWNDEDENIFSKSVYERFKTMEDSFI